MGSNQRRVSVELETSPSNLENTPDQVTEPNQFEIEEAQMYRVKYIQLTKYIEPLKRLMVEIGNDDIGAVMKIRQVLEVLCFPQQYFTLDTLFSCESFLEKVNFGPHLQPSTQVVVPHPLVEAVCGILQIPTKTHILRRIFRPVLELVADNIRYIPAPVERRKPKGKGCASTEIPHILQGEIAGLDRKFKVSLDYCSQNMSGKINLICYLDDKFLPSVPPIHITIPRLYPMKSPISSFSREEYSATPFFVTVQTVLRERMHMLPRCHSLTHVLNAWEMSIRHAFSPRPVAPTNLSSYLGI